MNSQDILRNLGLGFDIVLDNSETYDYELAAFDNDYNSQVINFTKPISYEIPITKSLSGHNPNRDTIMLCEVDNRINNPNYIYSGITYIFDFSEFAEHFNIVDDSGVILHSYENFQLNNDVYTYTGFTGETHYFKICAFNVYPTPEPTPTPTETPIPTPTETSTPTPTPTESSTPIPTSTETPVPTSTEVPPTPTATEVPPTPTVTPTIGCTLPHPETSTVFESCGGENFADSLSWACQMKDTFNSGGGCTGGTSYRTLYRDGSGVPSIGDPFYRYQNTCEVFTFLNGYSVLSTTDGYVVVNTLNGIVIGIENC
jgi:hypothetical protein